MTTITKKNVPEKPWVDKGTKLAGEFKILYRAEGIQIFSTMSETKSALAERTKRSLKKDFTVTWKTGIQVRSQIDSIRYNTNL